MKGLKLIAFVLGILALIVPQVSWAEEKTEGIIKLQEVVVSAARTDRMLVETPASISIITAEEIQEMGARNIVDVVENIPGVIEDSSTRDEVTIRGNRGPQSGGVLVLVDGVPANSGIGNYVQYDAIPLADIERVEVLRSSGSIAFGPDAARGVINIITKKGEEGPPQVKLSASYGSWDTWEESANVTGRIAEWDYALNGSRLDTDGYDDDQKRRSAARLGVGYNFSDVTRLGFNLAWRDVDYETNYGKNKWQVDHHRRDSIFPKSDAPDSPLVHHREHEDENIATSLDFMHKGEDFFLNGIISYDDTDHDYGYLVYHLDPNNIKKDYKENQDQERYSARVSGGYHFRSGQLEYTPTFGADYVNTTYDQNRTYPWADADYLASKKTTIAKANLDYERKRWGFFLANEFDLARHWELALSGRVDYVDYDVKNKQPKHVTKDHTDYSWNVTPAFHPTSNSTIYASASRSYWYPNAYYYKYAMEKDLPENRAEDLRPEEYLTYEVGYKHYFGSELSLALTGYSMKVSDKFLSLYDESDWQGYRNVGESRHRGIELEATGRLCPYFGYRFLGAYQDAEWVNAFFRTYVWGETPGGDTREIVDLHDKEVPHVPEFTSTLGLDFYFLEYFKFSTDINYYGRQYIDVLNRYEINDYMTFDAMLSYKRGNYKIWLLGNNIFDREVENMFNEQGRRNSDGTAAHLYYPIDGRYLEAGVTMDF